MENTAEVARLMAIKAALVVTTNTPGWAYLKKISQNIIDKTTGEALDEEDPIKGESKRLKASALKKGFAELFNAVETIKSLDFQANESNDFGDLDSDLGSDFKS